MTDEGDAVDIKDKLEAACAKSKECIGLYRKLIKCTQRVQQHPDREETCTEELFDLTPCVDKCAAPKLFAKLK